MFCDKAEISIKAGNGGNGHLSFLHEKYREFGGPDGGNGGDGGDVIFRVNSSWNTLYHYKTNRNLSAENGVEGVGREKHGRNGKDLIIDVPVGTSIYDVETGNIIADLEQDGSEVVIAKGGLGGFGNAHFASSTRQTPRFAELGTKGEEKSLRLELKLIADVALVGLPNIGKSTLLSVISAAKPKIADYQFTTIVPNLGVVERFGVDGFVALDLPGLIEGAAEGKGLGDEFLRHIERTRVVVHIIDGMGENITEDYAKINKEILAYNKDILKKPQILAVSRIDLLNEKEIAEKYAETKLIIDANPKIFKSVKEPFMFSAVTHKGVNELVWAISKELKSVPKAVSKIEQKVYTIADVDDKSVPKIEKIEKGYSVISDRLNGFVIKTDFSNPYAVERIYDIMTKMGIIKKIGKMGAIFGDKIYLGEKTVDYRG
ncbi:MAG: GTPase ObgE [bacterium]